MKTTNILCLSFFLFPFSMKAQNPLLVRDIAPGVSSSEPDNFAIVDNKLLFAANSNLGGGVNRELFVSDGTSSGTQFLMDIVPGPSSSSPQKMVVYDNKAYFIVSDSIAGNIVYRPWVSDGTVFGTYPILPPAVTPNGYTMMFNSLDAPENIFVSFNGEVYFRARKDNIINDYAIFKTDGSFAGAIIAAELPNSTNVPNLINGPVVFQDSIYFSGTSNGSVIENLYKSSGTISSVTLLKNDVILYSEMGTGVYCNQLFFCGNSSQGNGPELWTTDGTGNGTFELANIRQDAGIGSAPGSFLSLNGKLFFIANGIGTGAELYSVDSTLDNLYPSQIGIIANIPIAIEDNYLFPYNNKMYFSGHDFINGRELWSSDGTLNGTSLVADLNPGSSDADPAYFEIYCGQLYFSAYNPAFQLTQALYKTDGTAPGTQLIPGVISNPTGGKLVGEKIEYNGKLIFNGHYNVSEGNELYMYDAGCSVGFNNDSEQPLYILYPNPASTGFRIFNLNDQPSIIEISELSGKVLTRKSLSNDDFDFVDVTRWNNGCYTVKIINHQKVFLKKLIVSH